MQTPSLPSPDRRAPLSLPARWLGRFGVGKKLMLIYLLDLSAVIFISGILINEKYIAIDFARKEIVGNAYIARLREPMLDLAMADQSDMSDKLIADLAFLAQTEKESGAELKSHDAYEEFAALTTQVAHASGAERTALIARALTAGHGLLRRVGDQSNLILDPDLDSYYTMSLVVVRFPDLIELTTETAARIRAPFAQGRPMNADERTRFLTLEGKLDAVSSGIESDYKEAISASAPELQTALDPSRVAFARAIEQFRARSATLSTTSLMPQTEMTAFLAAQDALNHAALAAWTDNATQLDRLLDERVTRLFHRMWLHLGTALALLGLILSMVFFVARQIAVPLQRLARVADTVRKTGDRTLRAYWPSNDEIGSLVVAFNDMLEQLDRERMAQQELVAAARAAKAQGEFVEATPIALVVTSIPDHEILHANEAAQKWLHGRTSNPWHDSMAPEARARYFQAMADHDMVDEFEVAWLGGGDSGWALLSARRLNFQGRDAMLTAFTPINQMKQMERRLELWSKVYEESSEAIMILDVSHRIVSVNRAFGHITAYEYHEVINVTPDFMLADSEPAHFFDDLWLKLEIKPTWQGEIRIRRRSGEEFPASLVFNLIRDTTGKVTHYIGQAIDISERKENEERIQFLALHDPLTHLPNRSLCVERLTLAIQRAARTGEKVATLFLDLDRFKNINDSLGHHVGDALLREVAQRLLREVRAGDTVSRLGGDEFVIILNGAANALEIEHVVQNRLLPKIRERYQIEGHEIHVSCSIGIAIFPEDGTDIETLMRNADAAMYHSKAWGRNVAHFFTPELNQKAQERVSMESSLRYAAERNELALHYQPRVDAQTGDVLGAEGLLRWNHPSMGMILPGRVITILEESGLIMPVGAWVIREACRQYAVWQAMGLGHLCVSINLSAVQLRSTKLVQLLEETLAEFEVPPDRFEVELTESTIMDSVDSTLEMLHAFKRIGVRISIDDFGTGYSSLNYLNRFPIDRLKIDRSFVLNMFNDSTALVIVKAIIGLGHTLGLKVVAEGVEDSRQATALRSALCDEFQGHLFAQAMSAGDFEAWIEAQAKDVVVL